MLTTCYLLNSLNQHHTLQLCSKVKQVQVVWTCKHFHDGADIGMLIAVLHCWLFLWQWAPVRLTMVMTVVAVKAWQQWELRRWQSWRQRTTIGGKSGQQQEH
jgi:hypothetical protein